MNDVDAGAQDPAADNESIRGNPVSFGWFICAIGYGFLLISLLSIFSSTDNDGFLENGAAIATYLIALATTISAYYLINGSGRKRPDELDFHSRETALGELFYWLFAHEWSPPHRNLTVSLVLSIGVMSAIWTGVSAHDNAHPEHNATSVQEFAMAVPIEDESIPAEQQGAAAGGKVATIYWKTAIEKERGDEGFVKMLVGALLTIIFGLVYPSIARRGRKHELGFVERLVVPVLTAVLFGVGATEQASAESSRKNVELASRGQMPVWGLSREEAQVTVLRHGEVPPETDQFLRAAIEQYGQDLIAIQDKIAEGEKETAKLNSQLFNQLSVTHTALGDQNAESRKEAGRLAERLRQEIQIERDRMDQFFARLQEADNQIQEDVQYLTLSQRYEMCRLANAIEEQTLSDAGNFAEFLRRDETSRQRNFGRRFVDFFRGETVAVKPNKGEEFKQIQKICEHPDYRDGAFDR